MRPSSGASPARPPRAPSVNPVEFSAPSTLAEATDLLREEGAVALGGGTVVVALMKERLLSPRRLVWLGRIAGLRRIQVTAAGSLWIGGGTILLEITRSGRPGKVARPGPDGWRGGQCPRPLRGHARRPPGPCRSLAGPSSRPARPRGDRPPPERRGEAFRPP